MKDILLELVKEYYYQYSSTKQTTLYPDINEEQLCLVREVFSEYNPAEEIPLIFYLDGPNWDDTVRWFMLSNKRFYCKMFYYTHSFNVVDCLPLSGINSLVIKKNIIFDNTIKINGHKIGSLILYSRREASYLNEIIGLILNKVEKEDILDVSICNYERDYLPVGWENLENAQLFKIARDYFSRTNLGRRNWGFEGFYYGPFIPKDILERARRIYADYDSEQEVCIFLVDNTFVGNFGSIEPSGFVITNKYLYYKLSQSLVGKYIINRISLNDIKRIKIKCRFTGWFIINNNKPLVLNHFTLGVKTKAFQEVIEIFIKALNDRPS